MPVRRAREIITRDALEWSGVSAGPHRFGGTEYRLDSREIGHIHGDEMMDIPFSKKVRDQLVAAGRAQPHHVLPESGWVSFYLREPGDGDQGIALLHESYRIAAKQKRVRRSES